MKIYDEIKRLETIVKIANERLSKLPHGNLSIGTCKNSVQFRNGSKYIPKSNLSLAEALAQRQYEEKVVKACEEKLHLLKKYKSKLESDCILKVYENLSDIRKDLVRPYVLPDEIFVQRWETLKYESNPYPISGTGYKTLKGETVRSKSETIIANILFTNNIPYRYEYPLTINTGKTLYPDFTALNKTSRKEYIIEHLGLLDLDEYRSKAYEKILVYSKNGIFPGNNLLITFEDSRNPLDSKNVESMLRTFLL